MRPIAPGLSPNLEVDDAILALQNLLTPWTWVRGEEIKKLENWFRRFFNVQYVATFDSGRSAEYAILKSLGIRPGDEVLIQAFTCVAVPNSILWLGGKPVYVDIEKDTYNMDPRDLARKITDKTRAIIVQHTFGIAANMDPIVKLAAKNRLILIEDCAHALGATYKGKKVGTFGDAAFFSFGRDKIVSSVFGGVAIVRSKRLADRLDKIERELDFPNMFWVFQQLLHPVSFAIILPLYNVFNIGKVILRGLQRLTLLSKPVDERELSGGRPGHHPRRLSNALASLALKQLRKLERFNSHRKTIAAFYEKEKLPFGYPKVKDGDIFLRYPVTTKSGIQKEAILESFKKRHILLGDWYSNVIDPKDVELAKVGYLRGSCINAEQAARTVINLPTYPTFSDDEADRLITLIKKSIKP